ncbi:LPXTG-motif cell wall-anchored protein/TQXA domain-containing protein [Prauserella shujinwangii]|uniref:LPXTG-motif cell wall-anchored protein/TQXA domain-containing protein n=1 Tax=Prauserella shujinwangii TaxID=1453103 RepID=A0A2T0LVK3_9PSEU|nr:thioester domain-containing protein [Prauserella shujinwangii]PRX47799.1 LPXTG-motif cell wall-anchored protein/TQXA domain-containing protein [Prauserella shujinwangii]
MRKRSVLTRAGAAVVGASLAVLGAALPASADEPNDAKGTVLKSKQDIKGYAANVNGMSDTPTSLIGLKLDQGNTLRMYCVQIEVNIRRGGTMIETPWDQYPDQGSPFHKNRDKINWVLQHGYPAVDTAALAETLGADSLHDGLSKKEAITGTQAAIWHFSDGKDLNRPNASSGNDEADKDVLALYDYLTGEENKGVGEPAPTLELAPESLTGEAGSRIGPFTVSTTGKVSELKKNLPEGTTLTDADGNELSTEDIADGSEIYVDVPAEAAKGDGTFEITATGHVNTGRLFVGENYAEKEAQSLIVAQSEKVTLTAQAGAEWEAAPVTTAPPEETTSTTPPTSSTTSSQPAPAPSTTETPVAPQSNEDDLAQTGFSALTPLLIGAGLVVAGAGALLLQRRRKNTA